MTRREKLAAAEAAADKCSRLAAKASALIMRWPRNGYGCYAEPGAVEDALIVAIAELQAALRAIRSAPRLTDADYDAAGHESRSEE